MRCSPNLTGAATAVAVLALVAAAPARADHHTVQVSKEGKVGAHLADAKGSTLYVFKKDAPGKSACAGGCVAKWPLFYREEVAAGPGLKASDFGTLTRDDGQKQSTYKGMPLYYFAGDKAPGDAKGDKVGDVWFVAAP